MSNKTNKQRLHPGARANDALSPREVGASVRIQHYQLRGDDNVLAILRTHIQASISIPADGVYAVPSSAGLLVIKREIKDGRAKSFNEGEVLSVIEYSTLTDVETLMEKVYHDFMLWRESLITEDQITASKTMYELNEMQYRRLNSTLIFYSLFRLWAKPDRMIEVEELTPFYGGYNATNLRFGEWFDRKALSSFTKSGIRPQSLFRMISIGQEAKYKVVTAIAHVSNGQFLSKFNMSASRVVLDKHSRSFGTDKFENFSDYACASQPLAAHEPSEGQLGFANF